MKNVVRRGSELFSGFRKLRELEGHDGWSRDQLLVSQQSALRELIAHAMEHSRFYNERFRSAGVDPRSPLEALPTISKEEVMRNFDSLVTDPRLRLKDLEGHVAAARGDELWLGEYRVLTTGGTTGVKGIFVYNRPDWATLVGGTLRWARFVGMSFLNRGRRWRMVALGGSGPQAMSERAARTNNIGNTVRLTLGATEPLPRLIEQIAEFRPDSLVGYPTMIALLAAEQLDGRLAISPRVVITHSEQLTPVMRERITQAWRITPFDAYSTTETGPIGCECPQHSGMHLLEDTVLIEVVNEHNEPVPPGTTGHKVLATNLFNRTQPLIRYEISDRLTLAPTPCTCGRPFRLLTGIEGRTSDLLELPGRHGPVAIHPNQLIRVIEPHPDVRQFQIVRHDHDLQVKVVPREGAGPELSPELTAALRASLNEQGIQQTAISATLVDRIPRSTSPAAKHKLLVNESSVAGGRQ